MEVEQKQIFKRLLRTVVLLGLLVIGCCAAYWLCLYRILQRQTQALLAGADEAVLPEVLHRLDATAWACGLALVAVVVGASVAVVLLFWRSQRQVNAQMYADPVTGGYNTARFVVEAGALIRRAPAGTYAVVSLDLQGFKLINEMFGIEAGDRLLCYIYDTLRGALAEGELVGRMSSDHFKLLVRAEAPEAMRRRMVAMARRINAFNEALEHNYYLPVRVGICLVQDPQKDVIILRDEANLARKMAEFEEDPLCACAFYQPTDQSDMVRRRELLNSFDEALHAGRIRMYLQPKVRLSDGRIAGAEALARWVLPDGSFCSPAEFIPVLEATGAITRLDLFMFEQVCAFLRARLDAREPAPPISVNFSRANLAKSDILAEYGRIREQWGVPAPLLELELTETMIGKQADRYRALIERMHGLGFACSMDDFGSGYSSLTLLGSLPLDTLKLDKSFFDLCRRPDAGESRRAQLLVESAVQLAQRFHMATVAEGVEYVEEVRFLRDIGCDMVQGYYFSPPLPAEEFLCKLKTPASVRL